MQGEHPHKSSEQNPAPESCSMVSKLGTLFCHRHSRGSLMEDHPHHRDVLLCKTEAVLG